MSGPVHSNETVFRELAVQSQRGSASHYNELLVGLDGFLKNYLRRRIFEKNEIEEVSQEVLLAIHRSLQTYNSEKSFMGWFMSIVEHKIVDYIRKAEKRAELLNLESIAETLAKAQQSVDLKLDLERAMNKLGEKEKNILTLLKVDGQSIAEVSRELNITEANVKVIAHRAFQQLRRQIGDSL